MPELTQMLLAVDYAEAPVFAVLDGAQFDDLPGALMEGAFIARSLYIDRGDNDPAQVVTAPHLVWLDERLANPEAGRAPEAVVPALFALLQDRAAAVFWECPAGADILFRHLRGLNMVLYPRNQLPPAPKPVTPPADATHDMVLFRHADANAMTQTAPALTPDEGTRLIGPATAVIFSPDADWAEAPGALAVYHPPEGGTARPGPLRLSDATVRRMNGARLRRRDRRLAAYLRKVSPDKAGQIPDIELRKWVAQQSGEAGKLGVKSEAGMGRWCYLQMISDGKMAADPKVRDAMLEKRSGISPDQKVRILLQEAKAAVGRVA